MVAPARTPTGQPSWLDRIREFIRSYPLFSFFVLAFGLSWIAWMPYVLWHVAPEEVEGLSFPAVMGTTQLLGVLPGAYLGPILSAFIVTAVADGRAGLRKWGSRFLKWRFNPLWYLTILVGVPAMLVLGTLPLPGALDSIQPPPAEALLLYLPLLVFQMLTTGIAEEPGWREFAIPRLQRRHGALAGTLLLAPLWGAWHLPLFFTEWGGWPNVNPLDAILFILSCVPISIAMTWLFNRTGESLPVVMLFHASINNFFSTTWGFMFPTLAESHRASVYAVMIGTGLLSLVVLVATRGRLGYRPAPDPEAVAAGQVAVPSGGARPPGIHGR